jgi:hypothetical protein
MRLFDSIKHSGQVLQVVWDEIGKKLYDSGDNWWGSKGRQASLKCSVGKDEYTLTLERKRANGKLSGVKGASFEREVAKTFSERFRDYLGVEKGFLRNTTSGAVFGGKNAHRLDKVVEERQDSGDILTPPGFRFSIECKNYRNAPTFGSLFKGYAQWDKWLKQAKITKKEPILIVKYNGCEEVVFYRPDDIGEVEVAFNRDDPNFKLSYMTYVDEEGRGSYWVVLPLSWFLTADDAFFFPD